MDNEIELVLYEGFTADGTYAIGMNEEDWRKFKAALEYSEKRVAELEALLTDVRSFLLQLSLEAWRENTGGLEQKLKALGIEPIPPPPA